MLDRIASRSVHGALTWLLASMGSSDSDSSNSDAHRPAPKHRRNSADLHALRVLVVEDEFLPGMLLQEELRSAGCAVLGPFRTLQSAAEAALTEEFDVAILDINLRGEMVYPLAEDLADRGVPFIFLTGYASLSVPETLRAAPRLSKPLDPPALIKALKRIVPRAD